MKFLSNFLLIVFFFSSISYAQEKDVIDVAAEHLLEGKQETDMTYREMMQIMGRSATKMYEGILLQNKQMVIDGALSISGHRAPRHKPWLIMRESDQEAFKTMLLFYDEALHEGAENIIESLEENDWNASNQLLGKMTSNCIVCHQVWRDKVVKREFKKIRKTRRKRRYEDRFNDESNHGHNADGTHIKVKDPVDSKDL